LRDKLRMICMQPLGKTRSRPWENRGARQYHSDRTHERRGGLGGFSRKTIGALVVREDKTWYHTHPTTRVTPRSSNLELSAGRSPRQLVGSCKRISRGGAEEDLTDSGRVVGKPETIRKWAWGNQSRPPRSRLLARSNLQFGSIRKFSECNGLP
jgi:hypothetical protein